MELDEYGIKNIDKLVFSPKVEELSLWTNNITDYAQLVLKLKELPNLKAVWVNENPVAEEADFYARLLADLPNLQIINKQLTPRATEWVLKAICRDPFGTPLEVRTIS